MEGHTIERDPYLTVTAMDADGARRFVEHDMGHGSVVRVEVQGQADPKRTRFGARIYRVWTVAR